MSKLQIDSLILVVGNNAELRFERREDYLNIHALPMDFLITVF
jgi:hypothetical protein